VSKAILRCPASLSRRLFLTVQCSLGFSRLGNSVRSHRSFTCETASRRTKATLRRRAGDVRKVHTAAGGPPDLIVDDPRTARLLRDHSQAGPVELRSNLRGYEENGEPILEDDEADA